MTVRITQKILFDNFLRHTRHSQLELFEAQVQLSTGRRLNSPSDDPVGAARVLALADSQQRLETFEGNIGIADSFLAASEAALMGASDLVTEARTLAVQANNGTLSEEDRRDLADRVLDIIDSLIGLANSKLGDRYVFAGTRTSQLPYLRQGEGRELRVAYRGNDDAIYVDVLHGVRQAVNIPGSEIFGVREAGELQLRGTTGLAAGPGAFNGTGTLEVSVLHESTHYDGASGIQPGESSAEDTIIGPLGAHSVTIVQGSGADGDVRTISLDGGRPVEFTGTETDLVVRGPAGEVVHVDVTALDPAFNGTVAIEARGSLSLDGGTTRVAIEFTEDQRLTDPESGISLSLDTRAVRRSGIEEAIFGGTLDLFEVLRVLASDMLNEEGLSQSGLAAKINERIEELDRASESIRLGLAEVGGRRRALEFAKDRIGDVSVTLASLRSDIEDVDMTEAVARLAQYEQTLQAAMSTGTRLAQLSLLNYM
ncbi:MAG: flagellar hook-associated protein FlgL [Planctomycetota bacterium]